MKKVLHFIITPTIAVILILIKDPTTGDWLKQIHPNAPTLIIAFLILATVYSSYITSISPLKEQEEDKKKRWKIIDQKAEAFRKTFENVADLSFNIMVPKNKMWCKLEPNAQHEAQYSWFSKEFDVIWTYGTYDVNSHLKFTTKQGICGKAYTDEDFYIFDLASMRARNADFQSTFNFTTAQVTMTEKATIVASCPIVLKEIKPDRQSLKVLGVLNMETRAENAGVLVNNDQIRQQIFLLMRDLGNLYSNNYN